MVGVFLVFVACALVAVGALVVTRDQSALSFTPVSAAAAFLLLICALGGAAVVNSVLRGYDRQTGVESPVAVATPTPSPALSPSATPSDTPTTAPTESPTRSPTQSPTRSPTESPTSEATESPTPTTAATPEATRPATTTQTATAEPSPTTSASPSATAQATASDLLPIIGLIAGFGLLGCLLFVRGESSPPGVEVPSASPVVTAALTKRSAAAAIRAATMANDLSDLDRVEKLLKCQEAGSCAVATASAARMVAVNTMASAPTTTGKLVVEAEAAERAGIACQEVAQRAGRQSSLPLPPAVEAAKKAADAAEATAKTAGEVVTELGFALEGSQPVPAPEPDQPEEEA